MSIYPYPRYTKKEIFWEVVEHLGMLFFYLLYSDDAMFQKFILILWVSFIFINVISFLRRKYGWVAKIDEEKIYILKQKSSIPINAIENISRQVIKGEKSGIKITMKDGQIRTNDFAMLNDAQTDELVNYLNEPITNLTSDCD